MNDVTATRPVRPAAAATGGASAQLVQQLFLTYQSALRAYLFRRVRRRADAEELAQEVYLRMLRVPDTTAILNPEAYLYAIAGNLVKEYALQQMRSGHSVDPDDPPTEAEIYAAKPMPGIALGRTGTISEAGDAIFWLCSPLSNYVTGQLIPVNGGARGGMS